MTTWKTHGLVIKIMAINHRKTLMSKLALASKPQCVKINII